MGKYVNQYSNRPLLAFTVYSKVQAVRVLRKNEENRTLRVERKPFTLHQLHYILNGQF